MQVTVGYHCILRLVTSAFTLYHCSTTLSLWALLPTTTESFSCSTHRLPFSYCCFTILHYRTCVGSATCYRCSFSCGIPSGSLFYRRYRVSPATLTVPWVYSGPSCRCFLPFSLPPFYRYVLPATFSPCRARSRSDCAATSILYLPSCRSAPRLYYLGLPFLLLPFTVDFCLHLMHRVHHVSVCLCCTFLFIFTPPASAFRFPAVLPLTTVTAISHSTACLPVVHSRFRSTTGFPRHSFSPAPPFTCATTYACRLVPPFYAARFLISFLRLFLLTLPAPGTHFRFVLYHLHCSLVSFSFRFLHTTVCSTVISYYYRTTYGTVPHTYLHTTVLPPFLFYMI